MIRIILTLFVAACGAYLMYQAGVYVGVITARHPDGVLSLLSNPPFLLRLVGAFLLCAGAAFGLGGKKRMSKSVISLGTLCFLFLTVAIIAAGGDISLWMDEAIWSGVLVLLTAGLFKFR